MYQATVPEGSGPGDLITVQVNGSAFQATVPAGVHAGEAFDVQPQSQASSGPICTIVATADGLDGVFRPEMPAALEGKISREQWDPAIRKAAAAEAEVRGSRRRQ